MMYSLLALIIGFFIDLLIGDPRVIPHPIVLIGKLIDLAEKAMRAVFPKTPGGEKTAGLFIWIIVIALSCGIPLLILWIAYSISVWLGLAVESIMCWQIMATKSLKDEAMKVYKALESGDISRSRHAVSMIVGRDTATLDDAGVTKAAVETVAENSSDGVIAPLIFIILGGAPLGFLYKAVNTMDSMLGYTDPPFTNIGFFPARIDDIFNYIPARLSALFMLAAGKLLNLDFKNGVKIFRRDRYNHASPNSAQTESVCAGLLGLQLAGDAWYHGVLHKKKFIGDPVRAIVHGDIPLACRLMYVTAFLSLLILGLIKLALLLLF